MTDSLCSCCQIFGKPRARLNFIILASGPDSVAYLGTKHLLQNYVEINSSTSDSNLTDYDTLARINNSIYNRGHQTTLLDPSTRNAMNKCCYGFSSMWASIDSVSNGNEWDTFRRKIFDLLDAKINEDQTEVEPPTWVLIYGSACFEPTLLNIFIDLKDENLLLSTNTFAVLGLLVNEEELFKSWICRNVALEDYDKATYPEYERRTQAFFVLLNLSRFLQEHTLLVEERGNFNSDQLREILKHLFQQNISEYSSVNDNLRSSMEKLLKRRERTVRDVKAVRSSLLISYQNSAKIPLESIVACLKHDGRAAEAARKVINLILNEFRFINKEQKRAYRRQLLCGFDKSDAQNRNTVAAQMTHYALRLLKNYHESTVPLLYAVVIAICEASSHFYFRHEFFAHTQEVFTLSLLLACQQHYALAIAGLQLCVKILNADQNEHKYAHAYLSRDPSSARKILNTINWLLSPYQQLKKLWDDNRQIDFKSNDEESLLTTETKYCYQHTEILAQRLNLKTLSSLFYACFEHCSLVTIEDICQIVDVIEVLADDKFPTSIDGSDRPYINLLFITDLCAFLTPILLNGSVSVSLALRNQTRLLTIISKTITILLQGQSCNRDKVNAALRFYAQIIHFETKPENTIDDDSDDDDDNDEQRIEKSPIAITTTESVTQPMAHLHLTKDLLSSYYTLWQQFQMLNQIDETAAQQEKLQALFETEWKKLDILHLKYENEQFKEKQKSLDEKLIDLMEQLKRTELERDQYRTENTQIAKEIDCLKLAISTTSIIKSDPVPTNMSPEKDITQQTDITRQLDDLLPHQITTQQAEQFIREIYRRRKTFNDEDMRKSICGSLKHLGSDLYSSSVHFLHEIIQNAEDNNYAHDISPYLRIELNQDYILFSNNEQGLRACDVSAICSLAVSTKTTEQQHIGEKGVGFKSVFAASNQPMLISHSWKFRFQVSDSDTMSYITPIWVHDEDIPQCILNQMSANHQHTHLYLPLKSFLSDQFFNDISKAIDPCILLNMQKLRNLEVVDKRKDKSIIIKKQQISLIELKTEASIEFEDLTFLELSGRKIQLCTPTGDRTFRVYSCQINVPSIFEQRRHPKTSLTIAFPCEYDYELDTTVYTGLPVCDIGFNFMFNAEFHLVTSRESVRENVPFNTYLRDHLAVLFVYLLLNNIDLRKDISHYCPSSNIHQVKHSFWWLSMINRIDILITKYLADLFDIQKGKTIRYWNSDMASLITKEQLYDYANIQVMDPKDKFFTADRLNSLQIEKVSIVDVLECFPNRDDQSNEFQQWAHNQDERWWSHFFGHLSDKMTPDIAKLMLKKPVFIFQDNSQRQYLPIINENSLLLYMNDDPQIPVWKQRLTVLRYTSKEEKNAFCRSKEIQVLTEKLMIEIIQNNHLDLSASSLMMTSVDSKLLEEIWKDLSYLQSHIDKLDHSKPILVPIQESSLALIQNTTLPTIFSKDIRRFVDSTLTNFICLPYYNSHSNSLLNHLQWEYFLLKMHCKTPTINLSRSYRIDQLPILPLFTMFTDENYARLGEFILSEQSENTRQTLQQFPIAAQIDSEDQIRSVATTFDQSIVADLPLLPRVNIPHYCRSLALNMGVRVEYDLFTCATILQHLSEEKIINADLYVEWLGRLQLEIRQKSKAIDNSRFRSICQLYLPDQQRFCSLKNLLVMSEMNDQHRNGILLVCKYLKLQLISSTTNPIYWQFKDLFRILGCQCTVTIENIYRTILKANSDKQNFYPLGDHLTTLNETGMESMIMLFQYLENLIKKRIEDTEHDTDLYRSIITSKHPTAPDGSREDLQWRFSLISEEISLLLKKLIDFPIQNMPLPLLTIDRQLIVKNSTNIVYACFETKIIENLSRAIGKRRFILPVITQTCPLILALSKIDYVERRGKIKWIHSNINFENHLTQLTTTFQETASDRELEVISAKYVEAYLLISDGIDFKTGDEPGIDWCHMETDYPFWIFDKTVVVCTNDTGDSSSKAVIVTSALTTLLYKRHYVPFEEARLIARRKITDCTEFMSRLPSRLASTASGIYSYLNIIFPTGHDSIESMIISIGPCCKTERDPEEIFIATEWTSIDEIYRNRVRQQNHRNQNESKPNNWINPITVDGEKQVRIGQNAELFFFRYLQLLYGESDVTPTKNWRSSSRAKVFPQYTRNIDDSLGYDIELQDIKEYFVKGPGSRTKKCYFEVKGTSGSFHEEKTSFHISANEEEKCRSIAFDSRNRSREAYLLVIVEHCLDPEKISLVKVCDWSSNFGSVKLRVDGYQCTFRSNASVHTTAQNNYEDMNTQLGSLQIKNDSTSNTDYLIPHCRSSTISSSESSHSFSRDFPTGSHPYYSKQQRYKQSWRQPEQQYDQTWRQSKQQHDRTWRQPNQQHEQTWQQPEQQHDQT
ncbi:unnamed protein product [Rotaria magnacalcarata]|uniref:Sacsin/Nov domain-containing protein n=1 Tax=Rotaria magnacalcarata TaxID=392030 RepID=A0A815ZFT8_9BILA|nr:unnamed protein product [Rotaria magnacalcarata]CAF1582243.1 unnamed protein product [Rotaria magnacalcarata]CAF2218453.1 unnamed protein product [Rotaria magnacalcarata]CAF3916985.1 unnamed protein product [Rotaria magnacalcarata]CAF3941904.1 unnamed protein product [Rotaria magnacalcarata]